MELNTFNTPNPVIGAAHRDGQLQDTKCKMMAKAHFYIAKYYAGELSYEECVEWLMSACHHGSEAAKINIALAPTQPSFRMSLDA